MSDSYKDFLKRMSERPDVTMPEKDIYVAVREYGDGLSANEDDVVTLRCKVFRQDGSVIAPEIEESGLLGAMNRSVIVGAKQIQIGGGVEIYTSPLYGYGVKPHELTADQQEQAVIIHLQLLNVKPSAK